IYVTHDQEEALAISDRICVMSAGQIEQIGTPTEIYGDPQTLFVANFVGTLNTLPAGPSLERLLGQLNLRAPDAAHWTIRPESMRLVGEGEGAGPDHAAIEGTVTKFTYLGREAHVLVQTDVGEVVVQLGAAELKTLRSPGDKVWVLVPRDALMAFGTD